MRKCPVAAGVDFCVRAMGWAHGVSAFADHIVRSLGRGRRIGEALKRRRWRRIGKAASEFREWGLQFQSLALRAGRLQVVQQIKSSYKKHHHDRECAENSQHYLHRNSNPDRDMNLPRYLTANKPAI